MSDTKLLERMRVLDEMIGFCIYSLFVQDRLSLEQDALDEIQRHIEGQTFSSRLDEVEQALLDLTRRVEQLEKKRASHD